MSATIKAPPSDPALAGESNVPRILGLGITFHALALISFSMRMYTRICIVKSFGKDDIMMVLCMVCFDRSPSEQGRIVADKRSIGRRRLASQEEEWLR